MKEICVNCSITFCGGNLRLGPNGHGAGQIEAAQSAGQRGMQVFRWHNHQGGLFQSACERAEDFRHGE